jgi:hypothetical protein
MFDPFRNRRTGLGLRDIASHAYRASTRIDSSNPELSPIESLAQRSQALHGIRQMLSGLPGGYSKEQMQRFEASRREDSNFREDTIRLGEYPKNVSSQGGPAAEAARRAAQGAGMLAADVTSQGALSLWWFINAAQAASAAAGQQAMHYSLRGIPNAPSRPFSRQHYAVSAAFPLVLGASAAVGNLGRQAGYTAVLDDGEDRRESTNPLLEAGLRSIGMTGSLLPFNQFSQERPDVSRDEYERYKAYLYSSPMPVKFNPDGIHGAEVSLLGKSIPLLTGVLPIAAGVAGGAMGVRTAGKRLASRKGGNAFALQEQANKRINELSKEQWEAEQSVQDREKSPPPEGSPAAQRLEKARQAARALERKASKLKGYERFVKNKVEDTLLLGAITGSSAGLVTTGAGAALLEQIRRASNLEANRQEEQTIVSGQLPLGSRP